MSLPPFAPTVGGAARRRLGAGGGAAGDLGCRARLLVITVGLALAAGPSILSAQYPHAFVLPAGALRLSFEPELTTYDERFGPDGEIEPLGLDLSPDSAGPNFLVTLLAPQLAVQSIIGDATYQMTAGAVRTRLDADVRRFPFSLALGLTNRLTFTATIPIVTTRMQVDLTVDGTDANLGWNQTVPEAANAGGFAQVELLLSELEAAAASVDAQIAAGAFGCPTSAQCDQARDLVSRTRALRTDVIALTGVLATDGSTPPFAPLATSAAGQAILGVITAIAAELASFGAPAITASLPLPDMPVTADDINTVLTSGTFGYNAFPLAFAKLRNNLGDAEVGLRLGVLQAPNARATLSTTVRLPTGTLDSPAHFVDLGSGDKQLDVIGGLEIALEPGSAVGLALTGSYTLQLPHQLTRRVTIPERPIAVEAAETVVDRDLGDILELGVYPTIRLSRAFRVYLSGHYYKKFADKVSAAGTLPPFPGSEPVTALEQETAMELLSIGGGIYFRADEDRRGPRLPIEAGIDYRTAFDGKGGLTPRPTRLNFYLRLYFGLWWRGQ